MLEDSTNSNFVKKSPILWDEKLYYEGSENLVMPITDQGSIEVDVVFDGSSDSTDICLRGSTQAIGTATLSGDEVTFVVKDQNYSGQKLDVNLVVPYGE